MGKIIEIIEDKKETMIISYGIQYFCLHNYGNPHKTKFLHFKEELALLPKIELGDVLVLARRYEVNIVNGKKRNKLK